MTDFDEEAIKTINKLREEFGKEPTPRTYLIFPNSIGLEIEVKFKDMFSDIHKKYFSDDAGFYSMKSDKQETVSEEIIKREAIILPMLEKTIEFGIPRGLDKYWEFAFNPVMNATLLIYQIDILQQVGLIPGGRHSLHISIGNRQLSKKDYWILMVLELLFIDKERIKKGFGKDGKSSAWAKKGDGGILKKNQYDLIESEDGYELRTLLFDGDLNKLFLMLQTLNKLLKEDVFYLKPIILETLNAGLPGINWGRPNTNPEIWNKYIDNFDHLSAKAKELYL